MFRKRFFMHSLVMNSALLLMLSSNLAGKREYFAQETLLPEDFFMEDLTEEESPDPADLPESYGMQESPAGMQNPSGERLSESSRSGNERGIDLALVMDQSGSMKKSDPDYLCLEAAVRCIDGIRSVPGSRVCLIPFSDTLGELTPLTELDSAGGRRKITESLDHFTYTEGDTDIGQAMIRAVEMLSDMEIPTAGAGEEGSGGTTNPQDGSLPDREKRDNQVRTAEDPRDPSAMKRGNRKWIVLLTDGEIDLPRAENEEEAEKKSLTDALVAVETARRDGFLIDTVALRVTGRIDENLMTYMADMTGGSCHLVENASMLPDLFEQLPEEAIEKMPETEEESERETETETETETEPPLLMTGTIDETVVLDGLLPRLCRGELNLDGFFSSVDSGEISYTAYTADEGIAECSLRGSELQISGLSNGLTKICMRASLENGFSLESSFMIRINALIPSAWYLCAVPLLLLPAAAGLVFFRKSRNDPGSIKHDRRWSGRGAGGGRNQLSGTIQWYVKGEGERIYGLPSRQIIDLAGYDRKIRLSDFVEDELLDGADLSRVFISAAEYGIRIESRTKTCALAAEDTGVVKSLLLEESSRFRVLCETSSGRAAVMALYCTREDREQDEEEEEERTRLLI